MNTSCQNRVEALRAFMEKEGVTAVLVTKIVNLHYFSGFRGDDTCLVITPKETLLITDFRYIEQAHQQTDYEVVEQTQGLFKTTAAELKKRGVRSLAFEGMALCYNNWAFLQKELGSGVQMKGVSLEPLREVKDAEEIACIKKAVAISDMAFDDVLTYLRPGISELDVAAHMEAFMRAHGSEGPSFTTIIASGVRGSLPHGVATGKLLAAGEFVTMDYGAIYQGYHSDITRTVAIGHADEKMRHLYETVLASQKLGVQKVQPGASGKTVDKAVRDFLTEKGYGKNFGHGLGHSLGLEIHEEPRLSPKSTTEHLLVNMLITVEPGVYIAGYGGLRIEDTVLVTEKGGVPLTQADKRLIEVGA